MMKMKKRSLLLGVALGATLLSGCASDNGDSSNSSAASENSSSSSSAWSDENAALWSESDKKLMEEYCGFILPYPSLLSGEVKVEEVTDKSTKSKYLAITNEASSFSMKDYYSLLEKAGWNVIKSYTGEKVQSKSGTEYVELTMSVGEVGYDLTYYYIDGDESNSGYNCLVCRSSYTTKARSDTDWSEDDKKVLSYVFEDNSLPYIALGSDYSMYAGSLNELYAVDYYTTDLSKEYASILIGSGFALDKVKSIASGNYYLYKTYESGARIDIQIEYFNGNNIYAAFTPKTSTYSEWPTELTKEAIEASGNDIPAFEIAKGGKYITYKKHDVTYIYTFDCSSTFDYESYYYSIIDPLYCWNEKLSVNASYQLDDDYGYSAFLICFSLVEPTSTFFSSWNNEELKKNLKASLGIEGVDTLSLDLSSLSLSHEGKYVANTEEDHQEVYEYYYAYLSSQNDGTYSEDTIASIAKDYADMYCPVGIVFSFYDEKKEVQSDYITSYKVYNTYKDALYNAAWYQMPDTGGKSYEDPTGALSVKVDFSSKVSTSNVYTTISFTKGSGEAHSPVFEFSKELFEVGEMNNVNLILNKNMIPYTVTFSSSDPNKVNVTPAGKAIAKAAAQIGDEVTITASYTDSDGLTHSTSTKVKIVKGENYKTMMALVEDGLKEAGYTDYVTEGIISSAEKEYGLRLTVSLGKDVSVEEAQNLVNDKLIPEKYTAYAWGKYSKSDYASVSSFPTSSATKLYAKGNGTPSFDSSDVETLECWCVTDYLYLKMQYYVYVSSKTNETMLVIESTTFR